MSPKLTDIAPISQIMDLRFRPSLRAGSHHLMTSDELNKAINQMEERAAHGNRHARITTDALKAARTARASETDADRCWRLRSRIAWEVAQEKKVSAGRGYCASKY